GPSGPGTAALVPSGHGRSARGPRHGRRLQILGSAVRGAFRHEGPVCSRQRHARRARRGGNSPAISHHGTASMSDTPRVLPHNLDAEKAALGGIIYDNDRLDDALAERLEVADFYRNAHQRIYRQALQLAARKEPIDLVTLAAALEPRGELEQVGGKA